MTAAPRPSPPRPRARHVEQQHRVRELGLVVVGREPENTRARSHRDRGADPVERGRRPFVFAFVLVCVFVVVVLGVLDNGRSLGLFNLGRIFFFDQPLRDLGIRHATNLDRAVLLIADKTRHHLDRPGSATRRARRFPPARRAAAHHDLEHRHQRERDLDLVAALDQLRHLAHAPSPAWSRARAARTAARAATARASPAAAPPRTAPSRTRTAPSPVSMCMSPANARSSDEPSASTSRRTCSIARTGSSSSESTPEVGHEQRRHLAHHVDQACRRPLLDQLVLVVGDADDLDEPRLAERRHDVLAQLGVVGEARSR